MNFSGGVERVVMIVIRKNNDKPAAVVWSWYKEYTMFTTRRGSAVQSLSKLVGTRFATKLCENVSFRDKQNSGMRSFFMCYCRRLLLADLGERGCACAIEHQLLRGHPSYENLAIVEC